MASAIGNTAFTEPDSGRLISLLYGHRAEQQVVAKAESPSAAWNEAVRLAGLTGSPATDDCWQGRRDR